MSNQPPEQPQLQWPWDEFPEDASTWQECVRQFIAASRRPAEGGQAQIYETTIRLAIEIVNQSLNGDDAISKLESLLTSSTPRPARCPETKDGAHCIVLAPQPHKHIFGEACDHDNDRSCPRPAEDRCPECRHERRFFCGEQCNFIIDPSSDKACGHRCDFSRVEQSQSEVCPHCRRRECECSEFDASPELGAQ